MSILRSIVAWITTLESGKSFQKWSANILRFLGVIAILIAFVWCIALFVGAITEIDSTKVVSGLLLLIGIILLAFINIAVGIILVLLFWNRSNIIRQLDDQTDFLLLKIAIILIRLAGEVVFIVYITAGIQALISGVLSVGLPWTIGFLRVSWSVDMSLSLNWNFAILLLLTFFVYGIVALVVTYIFAALINLVIGMANDLRNIDESLSTDTSSSDE